MTHTDLTSFINSDSVKEVDQMVAEKAKCRIYDEDREIIIPFYESEIKDSELSIEYINRFIIENNCTIAEFGNELLKNAKERSLSFGVSISYAIYLIYLKEKASADLTNYLIRRRIPKPERFVQRLIRVAKSIKWLPS